MSTTDQFPETIRIGILVYEGFEPIDVWGFTEAFAISRFDAIRVNRQKFFSAATAPHPMYSGGHGQSETGKEGRAR